MTAEQNANRVINQIKKKLSLETLPRGTFVESFGDDVAYIRYNGSVVKPFSKNDLSDSEVEELADGIVSICGEPKEIISDDYLEPLISYDKNEPILKDDRDDILKIDDAIKQYTKTIETLKSIGSDSGAQFVEQIAKWLTELKEYKRRSNQLIWDKENLTILVICENNKAYDFIRDTFIAKANSLGIIREGTYHNLPFRIKVSEVCRQRVIFKVSTNQFLKMFIGFLQNRLNKIYRGD